MYKIVIISASVRMGRKSNRVASYFKQYIEQQNIGTVSIADLDIYQFPLFEERLKFLKDPSAALKEFAALIAGADGILIVTPEYNGGYPASLKNAIDVLYDEWYRKPVAIATVSAGAFGGSQVIISLQFSLWKMRALMVPAMFPVPVVDKAFDENGLPADKETTDKRASAFLAEFTWCMDARKKMG